MVMAASYRSMTRSYLLPCDSNSNLLTRPCLMPMEQANNELYVRRALSKFACMLDTVFCMLLKTVTCSRLQHFTCLNSVGMSPTCCCRCTRSLKKTVYVQQLVNHCVKRTLCQKNIVSKERLICNDSRSLFLRSRTQSLTLYTLPSVCKK